MRNLEKRKRNHEDQNHKNITYLEVKKVSDSQSTDLDFSKTVHSFSSKPETKTIGTQFFGSDFVVHTNTRVIIPSVKISTSKTTSVSQSNSYSIQIYGLEQIQRLGHVLSQIHSLVHSQVLSQALSQIHSLVHSQVLSQVLSQALRLVRSQLLNLVLNLTLNRIRKRTIVDFLPDKTLVEDQTLAEVHPLIDNQRDLMIQLKWLTNLASYMIPWKLRRSIFFS